ncbi:MAG TPA: GNAT family N-acetyltransferase [Anaerolineales bacterium]|nr:GNAT family N-acetyltransferase [Anaerolineales bacterium]
MTTIRRAIPSDADSLTQIAVSAKRHWNYPERWMEIWTPQLTFTPDYFEEHEGWATIDVGKPIAFYTLDYNNGIAWIENLWVLPEYIGRGVGKELFHHATALARGRGYQPLQLEADPNALGFYEKMGMRKIGERQSEVDGSLRVLPIMAIDL